MILRRSPSTRASALAKLVCAALVGATLFAGGAHAQAGRGSAARPPAAAPPPAPAPLETAPPYEKQLLRLAELLGALSWLSDLCAPDAAEPPGAQWRRQMTALLNAEGSSDQRRDRLAGAYNRGYRGYETTYRSCTPNAELVIARYLTEGERIARDVANRYGG